MTMNKSSNTKSLGAVVVSMLAASGFLACGADPGDLTTTSAEGQASKADRQAGDLPTTNSDDGHVEDPVATDNPSDPADYTNGAGGALKQPDPPETSFACRFADDTTGDSGTAAFDPNGSGSLILTPDGDFRVSSSVGDRAQCTVYVTLDLPAGHKIPATQFTVQGEAKGIISIGDAYLAARLREAGDTADGIMYETANGTFTDLASNLYGPSPVDFCPTEAGSVILKLTTLLDAIGTAELEVTSMTLPPAVFVPVPCS